MKICLIGGNGFIGSKLDDRLRKSGIESSCVDINLDARDSAHIFGDVTDYETLVKGVHGDIIVNLAAVHRDDVRPLSKYEQVNVDGARNICRVAEQKNINRMIFLSSVAVYGFAEPNTDEDGDIQPFNEYGRTKWEAEKVFRKWYEKSPETRRLVIIRPTVVFGEGNRGNVFNLFNQIRRGRFLMIGRGKNVKSIAYVENLVAFIQYCLEQETGTDTFNYVDEPDLSVGALVKFAREELGRRRRTRLYIPFSIGMIVGYCADLLSRLTGRSLPISAIRVKKFCMTTQFSSAAHKTEFQAPYSLQEGIRRTIRHDFLEGHPNQKVFYTE